jgi:hypothetical protein
VSPAADRAWLAGANRIAARRTVRAVKTLPAATLDALGRHSDLPVLTVYGDDDIYGPSIAQLRDRYSAARHIVVPACGHLPWLQAPEAFEHLIRDFYATTTGAVSALHGPSHARSENLRIYAGEQSPPALVPRAEVGTFRAERAVLPVPGVEPGGTVELPEGTRLQVVRQ